MISPPHDLPFRRAERARAAWLSARIGDLRHAIGPRLPPMALALQGGGAHGAFTWGVLDRLLEEPRFRVAALSGTSAGALNAVCLAAGWQSGGAEGARTKLGQLWREIADLTRFSPLQQGPLPQLALDLTAHLLSPYQLNPLGINPLRDLLRRLVDLEALQAPGAPPVMIAATDVQTGAARLFSGRDLSLDAVLASACLPQAFQAVEIEGRAYWDGGYASNPPLIELVQRSAVRDVLLIQINALAREHAPASAGEIRNRIGEIVFGRPLAVELEGLERWRRAGPWRRLNPRRAVRRLARHRLHQIDGSGPLGALDPMTKVAPTWSTLLGLRDLGRAAGDAWLAERLASSGTGRRAVSRGGLEPERRAA